MTDEPSLGETVNRAARLLRRLADERLAPFGLSSAYLPVLTALLRCEPLSQKALTEHAGIEQPTMAATLGRMERDGVIERRSHPADRRSAHFVLTSATREKTAAIAEAVQDLSKDALAPLSAADRKKFAAMLHDVAGAVEEALAERGKP